MGKKEGTIDYIMGAKFNPKPCTKEIWVQATPSEASSDTTPSQQFLPYVKKPGANTITP